MATHQSPKQNREAEAIAESTSAITRIQTRLLIIRRPHPAASIVDLSAHHPIELPIGSDNEDLVCGACGTVALANWSQSSTAEHLVVDSQMLIRCGRCRTYNVVPTARLAEEPREVLRMVDNRLRGLYYVATQSAVADPIPQHLVAGRGPVMHKP